MDLTAKLLNRQTEVHADQWDVVELPAIFEDSGNVLWPEFWKKEELEAVKASIPVAKWNAQYQQNPTSEEGAIVKREWWNICCLLYTSPSPRDGLLSRMPSSA